MRRVAFGATGTLFLLLSAACSSGSPTSGAPTTGSSEQRIINGAPDNGAHPGVLAFTHIVNQTTGSGTGCTGSVVAVKPPYGYLLLAAHCVLAEPSKGITAATPEDSYVMAGEDNHAPTYVYAVTEIKAHPSYASGDAGSPYDFAVVKFTGATSATQTVPMLTASMDDLAAGSPIQIVGYGVTSAAQLQDPASANSIKNQTSNVLSSSFYPAVSPLQLSITQTGSLGGQCQGDSGGPWLYTKNGTQYVAGVTSFGDQYCQEFGVAGRVSAVIDSFINPYINSTAGTAQTCDQCQQGSLSGMGSCVATRDTCVNDTACGNLWTGCDCATTDQACIDMCRTNNAAGATLLTNVIDCICQTGCASECATDSLCVAPTCGISFGTDTCGACIDAACCAQESACSNDATCSTKCFTTAGSSDPACPANVPTYTLEACIKKSCTTQCEAAKCGFIVSDTPGDPCEACFETKCCAQSQACAYDATCNGCAGGSKEAACSSNALFTAFIDCYGKTCAAECGTGTGGTGGSTGAGGSTGTGGSTATGTGGSSVGTGGSPTGAGVGGSPIGGSPTGAGPTGAGPTGAGLGGAGGAFSSAGGTTGSGNQPVQGDSGSSGGCSVPASGAPIGSVAWVGIGLAALATSRRRRARLPPRTPGPRDLREARATRCHQPAGSFSQTKSNSPSHRRSIQVPSCFCRRQCS